MAKPKIRFKGYTDDWEQRKFGDLGSVAMCKRIFKEQTSTDGDIPFYKIGTFGAEPDAFISRELFEEYRGKFQYPNIGDMLISASGTIGRTVEYKGEEAYFQDSNIVWFKHDDRVDNSFLKCIYEIVKWSGIEGSTIKRLYNDNFLKTEFSMPKVAEQQQIGMYFQSLDHLITLHQRKCEETKKLKKYMLQKMFPQNGQTVPEIRFSGFTDAWEQRKLGEIATETYGGGTPKTSNEEFWKGDIPWIQSSDLIDECLFDVRPRKCISQEAVSKSATKLVPQNSIAIVTRVGVGKLAFMPFSYATSQDFLSLSGLKIDPEFTVYALYKMMQSVSNEVQGTSIKGVTKDELLAKKIIFPSCNEQKKIGAYLHNLDHLITLHQYKCEQLQSMKKFMLQNMFV